MSFIIREFLSKQDDFIRKTNFSVLLYAYFLTLLYIWLDLTRIRKRDYPWYSKPLLKTHLFIANDTIPTKLRRTTRA